ncbi:MAG TPA: hypothetical protein VI488_17160 [Candidatus Angelobacter sp.]
MTEFNFVPFLYRRTGIVAVLAFLAERKFNNLRVFNTPRKTDSVPGHHLELDQHPAERWDDTSAVSKRHLNLLHKLLHNAFPEHPKTPRSASHPPYIAQQHMQS